MLYEKTSKAWKWWIAQQCPSGYKWVPKTKMKWVPKTKNDNVSRITNIVQLIIFIVDSGCTKHMTGNLKLLCSFIEKYMGIVHFGNDQFASILGYGDFDEIKEMSETSVDNNTSGPVLQRQKVSDYDNSGPVPQLQNISPSADTITPSKQELDLLFGPMYDEFFTTCTSSVNKSSSPTDNSTQQDTPPTMNIQSSIEPTTPTTNVNAEENNDNQAADT
ncbi:hypothetical protein Tco_1218934 [Tanacetum coccineum]